MVEVEKSGGREEPKEEALEALQEGSRMGREEPRFDRAIALEAVRLSTFSYIDQKSKFFTAGLKNGMSEFATVESDMRLKLITSKDVKFADGSAKRDPGIIQKNDSELLVTHDTEKGIIAISWRGTNSFRDWVCTNINVLPALWPHAPEGSKLYVSSGFKTAYDQLHDYIEDVVKGLLAMRKYCCIIVTGHSLGGALAQLNAHALSYKMPKLLEDAGLPPLEKLVCYTFGAPEAGNLDFVKDFASKVPHAYRIVNGADIVSRLPIPGRQHGGITVLMDSERLVVDPTPEDKHEFFRHHDSFFMRLVKRLNPRNLWEAIDDHEQGDYLRFLASHYLHDKMSSNAEASVDRAWKAFLDGSETSDETNDRINQELINACGQEKATSEVLRVLLLFCRKCQEINLVFPGEFDNDSLDAASFRTGVWLLIANDDAKKRELALRLAKLREVYDLVDSNGNGLTSVTEYANAVVKVYPEKQQEIEENPSAFLRKTWKDVYKSYLRDPTGTPDELSFTEFVLWALSEEVDPEELKEQLK